MRTADPSKNENTKKVQAKTNTVSAPTKAKSNSKVYSDSDSEASSNAAVPKKSYKEYKSTSDKHTTDASPSKVAQLFQQLKGKVDKPMV